MPLHIRSGHVRYSQLARASARIQLGATLAIGILCACPQVSFAQATTAQSQSATSQASTITQTPVAAPATINFRERPKYTTDPQRLRRTVRVDGILSDGEWDPFYTISDGAIKGVVYCNWDDHYLYLAARTEQPADLLVDLDMGGDGWLRGADNLEIMISNVIDGATPIVTTRLLDAASNKDTPTWNEKSVDPKTLMAAGKVANGVQVVELAIPRDTASLVLRPGVSLGVRAEFLPAGAAATYLPTQPFEPHLLLDAKLVDTRVEAMAGVNPHLTLSDYKCIAGQTLQATLELLNQTDVAVPIKSLVWSGQGNSVNAVNALREVAVPPIPAQRTLKRTYKTPLPPDLSTGSYSLNVVAEMNGGKQVQSTVTFAVVEPVQVQMSSTPQPVAIIGTTKLTVDVDIFSAVPNSFHGDVELTTVPNTWELTGGKKRHVNIDHEDANTVIHFQFKLPSNTAAGDYPVEAAVTWHKRTWNVRTLVQVIRTDSPAPAKQTAQ